MGKGRVLAARGPGSAAIDGCWSVAAATARGEGEASGLAGERSQTRGPDAAGALDSTEDCRGMERIE
jgi:hypothetical protein